MPYTIWLTRPFDASYALQAASESQATGILLEGEIPGSRPEAVNWPDVILHLQNLNIFKGVATNFAPFVHQDGSLWPELSKPLVDAGYACVTECFISESPNSTPANMNFTASQLGWSRTQPMIEGKNIPAYGDLSGYQNVSHWSARNVL